MDNIENIWNYTARNVIIPDPSLHDGEIDVSYHTFRILFKYKIIYYMMKINDIQLSKAYHKWKNRKEYKKGGHRPECSHMIITAFFQEIHNQFV